MNSSPLKDARIRIELDTDDAQARLDLLEEKMEEITGDIQEGAKELKEQEGKSSQVSKKRREMAGLQSPSADNTGPGKFGLRQIPQLLGAANLAGAVPGIGGSLRFGVEAQQKYGPAFEGIVEGAIDQSTESPILRALLKTPLKSEEAVRKFIMQLDLRMKTLGATFDKVAEMAKAQLLTGGHLDGKKLAQFASTAYDWEFVNARKDRDLRDKTLKMLAEYGIKDIMMKASEGKLVP